MTNYGFKGRLDETFPSQIMVDLTEVCNLKCTHCSHPEFKKSKFYHARNLHKSLNEKMVDEVRKEKTTKTQYIRYTSNGEPMLHPDFIQIILYAIKFSEVKVTVTSNGTIFNENIGQLFKDGLQLLDISLDANSDQVYKLVRGGNFNKVKGNVLKFIELRNQLNSKTKIIVSFIEQEINKHELENFKDYWTSIVDDVIVRRLHSNAGDDTSGLEKFYGNSIQGTSRRPCLYPWERIVLNARGMLSFCPTDWYGKSEICDYNYTTIKEIWQNNFYKDLRNVHLTNDYSNCSFCNKCPDWKFTRWPFQDGKSYADLVSKVSKNMQLEK